MNRFRVTLLPLMLALGGLAATALPAAAATPVTLALDWYPNADHEAIYTAQAMGYFADEGIDLKIEVPSDTTVPLKLVASGKIDFGVSYEPDVFRARAQGIGVKSIFGLIPHPLTSIMTLKSSGITTPGELAGKTIGGSDPSSDLAIIQTELAKEGKSLSDVKFVNVGWDLLPALISGKVDAIIGAYWNVEAVQADMTGHPVNVMRLEQWGMPNEDELVIVASDSMLQKNPDLVRHFLKALSRGYDYALAHPDEALTALTKANPDLVADQVKKGLDLMVPALKNPVKTGWQAPDEWAAFGKWMSDHKLLDKPVDPTTAYTNAFLP